MNFVLDASMALSWCFNDESDERAVAVLERLRADEAVAPALWPLEVTNGLLVAERRGRLNGDEAAQALGTIAALPVAVEPVARQRTFESTYRVARAHGLSSYDAAYLELAARLGLPLATLDGALAAAAEAEGVNVLGS